MTENIRPRRYLQNEVWGMVLHPADKLILLALARYADIASSHGYLQPRLTVKTLMVRTGFDIEAVQALLQEAIEKRIVFVSDVRGSEDAPEGVSFSYWLDLEQAHVVWTVRPPAPVVKP